MAKDEEVKHGSHHAESEKEKKEEKHASHHAVQPGVESVPPPPENWNPEPSVIPGYETQPAGIYGMETVEQQLQEGRERKKDKDDKERKKDKDDN